jgi:type IV secretion system protein VirB9
MMKLLSLYLLLLCSLVSGANAYVTGTPVPTDSRIKTFVYHANDVYRVLTHYGYQMNIEFGEDEEIDTISVGDRTGWQITPTENRLFIRAMDDKAHTNMTVITDQRSYQFDLYAAQPGEQGWDELVYVVRFYYPEEKPTQFAHAQPAPPRRAQPVLATYPVAPMVAAPPPAPIMAPAPMAPSSPMPMIMPAPVMPMSPMMQLPPPPAALMPQNPPMAMPAPRLPQMPAPMPQMQQMPPMAMPVPRLPQMPAPMSQMPPMMMPSLPPMAPAMPQHSPRPQLSAPALPGFAPPPSMNLPLPPVSPPPMASPSIMAQPATPVPPVRVQPGPMGMIPPPQMAVAPPPKRPHPRAPYIANQSTDRAQSLARKYPKGSYANPILAPKRLPSLSARLGQPAMRNRGVAVSPMGLPLPSTTPQRYLNF